MDKLPFDPYDFFGYIASGVLFGFPDIHSRSFNTFETACLILFVYVFGQIFAGPAKTILEDFFVCRILGRSAYNLLRADKPAGRWLFPGYFKQLTDTKKRFLIGRFGLPT